jgi:hypothetical protein
MASDLEEKIMSSSAIIDVTQDLQISESFKQNQIASQDLHNLPKKIENVYYYSGAVPYRYMLEGMKFVSFPESELMPSKEEEQKFIIKKIIGKKILKKKIYYLVWWKNEPKKDATWEPKAQLLEDGALIQEYMDEYENSVKQAKKKKKTK